MENPTNGTLSYVKYTAAECGYVLEVMRKFTLSYAVSQEEEFIPALCPNETPGDLYPSNYKTHLKYEREYTYLPDSVVHQLMIYCYQHLRLDMCWRKGMRIEMPAFGLTAVVSMGSSDQLLTIDVYSDGRCHLWELLQPILNAIDRINDRLNLKAKDYVWPETIIDGQKYADDRFELEYVLNLKQGSRLRRPKTHVEGKEVDHSIDELLYEIYGEDSVKDILSRFDHDETKRLSQSVLAGASLSHCVIIFGDVNQQYQGISEEILKTIVSNQPNETFLAKFAQILANETNAQLRELGELMKRGEQEKKPLQKVLSEYLDPAQKTVAISSGLVTLWPHIWSKLYPFLEKMPDLTAKLGELISKLPH